MEIVLIGIGAFLVLIGLASPPVQRFFSPRQPVTDQARPQRPGTRRATPIPPVSPPQPQDPAPLARDTAATSVTRAWAAQDTLLRRATSQRAIREASWAPVRFLGG